MPLPVTAETSTGGRSLRPIAATASAERGRVSLSALFHTSSSGGVRGGGVDAELGQHGFTSRR